MGAAEPVAGLVALWLVGGVEGSTSFSLRFLGRQQSEGGQEVLVHLSEAGCEVCSCLVIAARIRLLLPATNMPDGG